MPPKIPASSSISRPSNLAHRDLMQPPPYSPLYFWGSERAPFCYLIEAILHFLTIFFGQFKKKQ